MELDHQKFMQVEFNGISSLWEVRLDGRKQFEAETFDDAAEFAHRWCDQRQMANIFLSFNTEASA